MINILLHNPIKRSIFSYLILSVLLILAHTTYATSPEDLPPNISEAHLNIANNTDTAALLPQAQHLPPPNAQCLYTTIIMSYLLPVRQEVDEVIARIDQLFGMQPAYYLNPLYETLQNPNHYLTYLYSDEFDKLITAFMARMQIKKGTWGGAHQIQTIATKLKVNIQTHYPNPSNPTHLIQANLTKPLEAVSNITLHIVQDKVHASEVPTQAGRSSAKNNPCYQHYRFKYTPLFSIQVPILPSKAPSIPRKSVTQSCLIEWFEAASSGNRQQLATLLGHYNINVNTKNNNSDTALLWSAHNGHLDCLKYLIQQGADIHDKNQNNDTSLLLSAYNGHLDCLKYLVQQGAFLHDKDKKGDTALLYSACSGHLHCLKYLIQQGTDIHERNEKGSTALLLSAHKGHLHCVKFLIQQGADIHDKDKKGDTALLYSASSGHLDCVKYLIQQGANIHDKNKIGSTALLYSAYYGHFDCLKFLLQQNANIHAKNVQGNTALILSTYNGHLACVKYLVEQGADTVLKGEAQKNALQWARSKEVVNYLLNLTV